MQKNSLELNNKSVELNFRIVKLNNNSAELNLADLFVATVIAVVGAVIAAESIVGAVVDFPAGLNCTNLKTFDVVDF